MSIYRKQATCELFYRHNSGPLPDDISSCPPCAYLNQDSAALAIVAHTKSIPGIRPPFDISHNGEERRQGGGQGSDNERDERGDGGCLGWGKSEMWKCIWMMMRE